MTPSTNVSEVVRPSAFTENVVSVVGMFLPPLTVVKMADGLDRVCGIKAQTLKCLFILFVCFM